MDHPPRPLPDHVEVLVVGTGFSGLAAAIKLRQAGHNVAVIEKASDVGGTWRDNSYPACACDVPSHLYSFSFAPNPSWSRTFSAQPEIDAYLGKVATDFGVRDLTWFDTELLEAEWRVEDKVWQVRTSSGDLTADLVVLAAGALSEPALPGIPGLETFDGACFHSATWDHAHDFTGERVAVIGTGASAVQFAPEVAKVAARLTVFQRTAPWILPRRDRAITRAERWLFRLVPAAQKLIRGAIYSVRESWVIGFSVRPQLMSRPEKMAVHFIARKVSDPALRAKVTPSYRLGCKRVLLSNTWYPMLNKPHVDLVTDRIVEVTRNAVVTADAEGRRTSHEVDTLLLGTGFKATDLPVAHLVRGADGRTLAEQWAETGMRAHLGLTVAGYPNLFMIMGPNTGQGHTSVVYVVERQVAFIVQALAVMRSAGAKTLETTAEAEDRYNAEVQRRMARTVWSTGGCQSWYVDAEGRNTTLWPTFTFLLGKKLREVDQEDYVLAP